MNKRSNALIKINIKKLVASALALAFSVTIINSINYVKANEADGKEINMESSVLEKQNIVDENGITHINESTELNETVDLSNINSRNTSGMFVPQKVPINFNDQFIASGILSGGDMNFRAYINQLVPNAPKPYVIQEKDLLFGSTFYNKPNVYYTSGGEGRAAPRQTIALSTKFTVNVNRPFTMTGTIDIGTLDGRTHKVPDGFAIAIHQDEEYAKSDAAAKNHSGSFGLYHIPRNGYQNNGVAGAVIMEVDTFRNAGNEGIALLEPPEDKSHLAIMETKQRIIGGTQGVPSNLSSYTYLTNYRNQPGTNQFTVRWNPFVGASGQLTFTLGGYTVTSSADGLANMIDMKSRRRGEAYITFAGSVKMDERNTQTARFHLEKIDYDDLNPSTSVQVRDKYRGNQRVNYVVDGEDATIRHEFKNNTANTQVDIKEQLFMDYLKIKGTNTNLSTRSLKYDNVLENDDGNAWTNINDSFGFNNPIYITFPRDQQHSLKKFKHIFEYDIDVPKSLNYGENTKLEYQYRLGQIGMNHFTFKGEIDVRAKNKITSRNKADVDLMPVNSVNEITEAKLWEDIKVDSSGLNGTTPYREQVLNMKAASIQDMNVDYEYFVNNSSIGKDFRTPVAGNVYGLKVTITDKNNDPRLANSVMKVMYAGKYKSQKEVTEGNGNRTGRVLFADDSRAPIVATKLNKMSIAQFENHVRTHATPRLYYITKDNIRLDNSQAVVDTSYWRFNTTTNLDKKPGRHPLTIYIRGYNDTIIGPMQEVTDNPYSVDDGVNDTTDGTTGYVIIPSGIELVDRKEGDKKKIVAEPQVFFAPYLTNTRYDIYVSKSVELTNTRDSSKKFAVVSTAKNQITDGDLNYVGTIGNGDRQNAPLRFKLEADRDQYADIIDNGSSWEGTLTFSIRFVNN